MNVEKFRKDFDGIIDAQGSVCGEDLFEELFYYATSTLLKNCPCKMVAMRIVHESIGIALAEYEKHLRHMEWCERD